MKRILEVLMYVSLALLPQVAASQSPGIGLSGAQSSEPRHVTGTVATQQLELDLINENSIGVGSGEIVFLRGAFMGKLAEGFFQKEDSNYEDALQKTLSALLPLLGDLYGRQFSVDRVIDLPAQKKLVRFHQIIEGASLPTSNIFANNEGEIESVSLYSIDPKTAKSDFEEKLPDTELSRLFKFYASKYFESLGAQLVVDEKAATGPVLRYLDIETSSGLQYRYVADFFYDGYVFVLDAISGELLKEGFMGAAGHDCSRERTNPLENLELPGFCGHYNSIGQRARGAMCPERRNPEEFAVSTNSSRPVKVSTKSG
tara:strand:- start:321 stop:1265 length:945 start_codon:yes stop_codon:yes gene_type:complete